MDIDARIAQVAATTGKRLIVRPVRTPERDLRGYVEVRPASVLIEYVEELPGFFWGYELLERLLAWVEEGGGSAWFYECNGRLVHVPAEGDRRPCEG